jgi:pimeloyl-ACP methyl ester carboxylesterase
MTLAACNADEACIADMGGEAVARYDALAARLRDSPATFAFPLPSGGTAERRITFGDLESAAAGYLYAENGRMILLRALAAAASRDDFVPLARILYESLSLDPETLAPVPDPTFSDAIYYSVECNDYDYGPAEEYIRAGDAVDASLPRFDSIFYGDLPCAFWPEDDLDAGRPAPLVAEGLPTLVMVGTADPATPLPNARRIIGHLDDGYLVIEQGGPHVIFGWGNECVDSLVTDFLVDDILPARETSCPGVVTNEYLPLAPADASAFADPLEALASVDDEVYYLPEYYYWDLETETAVGCPYGGTLTFGPAAIGEVWELDGCAFARGFVMTGSALYDYIRGEFTLTVSVSGLADGQLVYTRSDDWTLSVTGTYAGQEVNLTR